MIMARILSDEQVRKLVKMLTQVRFRDSNQPIPEGDWRTMFDSDYARMVLSAPVRRLQDKTQVFPLESVDFARTRLTHSMEVAYFARSMGYAVEKILKADFDAINQSQIYMEHWIPKILEVASLVHDIGNPPFGHQGEECIKEFFKELSKSSLPHEVKQAYANLSDQQRADFENFDGNVQGFRVLCKLGLANDEYSYNLTKPVLSTVIKYPYSSLEGNKKGISDCPHDRKKFGFYTSEEERYYEIINTLEMPSNLRHPLTYLLEAADDIAYTACDVEDGYHLGIISLDDIKEAFEKQGVGDWIEQYLNISNSEDDFKVQTIRIKIHSKMIVDCVKLFLHNLPGYIDGTCRDALLENSDSAPIAEALKKLEIKNVRNKRVVAKEKLGKHMIEYLLKQYLCALFSKDKEVSNTKEQKIFNSMSENYWQAAMFATDDIEHCNYCKFQYVVDQVAGMTDSFLIKQYQYIHQIRRPIVNILLKIYISLCVRILFTYNRLNS